MILRSPVEPLALTGRWPLAITEPGAYIAKITYKGLLNCLLMSAVMSRETR